MYAHEAFEDVFYQLTEEDLYSGVLDDVEKMITAKLKYDPLLLERITTHVEFLKETLQVYKTNKKIDPTVFDEVALELRAYGRILDVVLKMQSEQLGAKLEGLSDKEKASAKKEEAFHQADVTAQLLS